MITEKGKNDKEAFYRGKKNYKKIKSDDFSTHLLTVLTKDDITSLQRIISDVKHLDTEIRNDIYL